MTASPALLAVEDLLVMYGGVVAVNGVSISVREGEAVGLAGANAAGKSTVLKAISGLVKPRAGSIRFAGQTLERRIPHRMTQMGIAQVPAGRHLFADLTVRDNLRLGALGAGRPAEDLEFVLGMFPHLRPRLGQVAGTLSGGEQQMVAVARGLMARPKLLMIDELSLGLAPKVIHELYTALCEIRDRQRISLLVVDHNLRALSTLVSRVYVLRRGSVAVETAAADMLTNKEAIEAYLGSAG